MKSIVVVVNLYHGAWTSTIH